MNTSGPHHASPASSSREATPRYCSGTRILNWHGRTRVRGPSTPNSTNRWRRGSRSSASHQHSTAEFSVRNCIVRIHCTESGRFAAGFLEPAARLRGGRHILYCEQCASRTSCTAPLHEILARPKIRTRLRTASRARAQPRDRIILHPSRGRVRAPGTTPPPHLLLVVHPHTRAHCARTVAQALSHALRSAPGGATATHARALSCPFPAPR